MSKNERTSRKVATIASRALRGLPITKKDVKTLAASALTQRPNKRK